MTFLNIQGLQYKCNREKNLDNKITGINKEHKVTCKLKASLNFCGLVNFIVYQKLIPNKQFNIVS